MSVGDRVKINPVYHTELIQKLVGGKTGTIVDINRQWGYHTYVVKLDEPYKYMGYTINEHDFFEKELILLEE